MIIVVKLKLFILTQFGGNRMLGVFWLTTDCNMKCIYCYEGNEKKKMYMQFYESSYFLLARKSIRYSQQRQYQKLGIIVYPFTSTIPTFRCLLNNHQRRYRYSARQRSNHLFRQSIGKV